MTAQPTIASNQELIDRFKDEPAPLLPILHAFHDRDGFLSEEAIREGRGKPELETTPVRHSGLWDWDMEVLS